MVAHIAPQAGNLRTDQPHTIIALASLKRIHQLVTACPLELNGNPLLPHRPLNHQMATTDQSWSQTSFLEVPFLVPVPSMPLQAGCHVGRGATFEPGHGGSSLVICPPSKHSPKSLLQALFDRCSGVVSHLCSDVKKHFPDTTVATALPAVPYIGEPH
ncbi:hypothetical protein KIL84_009338 [Mauremys mutica]|uniref:Uncharacterized protein n=1 Tax=Mauremys mutica TaxID=74926 RepID=A0A9D3XIE1_9SAUR|nr:hypothetical protein KIL84_009338 [Mauremys mutica]